MLSKPQTSTQETVQQTSLLNRFLVVPAKKAFSYVRNLVSNDIEISETLVTPHKVIISRKNTVSTNEANESFQRSKKVIPTNKEDSHTEKNALKKPIQEFLLPLDVKRPRKNGDSNFPDSGRRCVESDVTNQGLSDFEKKFLKSKNVKMSEDFEMGISQEEPTDSRMKMIKKILETIKYTIDNREKYTPHEILIARKMIEEDNKRKLQKCDLNKMHFVNSILCNRFDPGSVIYKRGIDSMKSNLLKISHNNISFQQSSENLSDTMSPYYNPDTTYIKCDEVSDKFPEKKLFQPINNKRTYEQHMTNSKIVKEESEKACRSGNNRCADCIKKTYEVNQVKIKLKDRDLEIQNLKKNQMKYEKLFSSQDQTPSSINRNYTNVFNSGSITMSHSKESINTSFVSQRSINRTNQADLESRNPNNFNLRPNPSAILEETDEENYTASKNSNPQQFMAILGNNNLVSDSSRGNVKNNCKDEIVEKKKDENTIAVKKETNCLYQFNVINLEYNISKNEVIEIENRAEGTKNAKDEDKIFIKEEKIAFYETGRTKINQIKPENEKQGREENRLKSVKKDLSKNFENVNKSNTTAADSNFAIIKKTEEPKINIQLNINSSRIDELSEIDANESIIAKNQNVDIKKNITENLGNSNSLFPNNPVPLKDVKISKNKFDSNSFSEKETNNSNDVANIVSSEIGRDELKTIRENMSVKSGIINPTVDRQFIERPKGRIANIEIPIIKELNAVVQQKSEISMNNTENKNLCQDEPINRSQIIATDLNTKATNLLSDVKTNPFLQVNFPFNVSNGAMMTNGFPNNATSFPNNNFLTNNNFGSSINNNTYSAINNIQTASPSSSTYSDVTFGGKNISDSLNHFNGNIVNHNAFHGSNFTANTFNPHTNMNTYANNNLATVCEEGRMSVEKVNPVMTDNTNREMNYNFNSGTNAFIPSTQSQRNFPSFNAPSNKNFNTNTNSNLSFKPEPKIVNNAPFKNNNQPSISNNNNNNWSSQAPNPVPNSHFGSNSNNVFGRNNIQPDVNNNSQFPNQVTTNPFMINKSNYNNSGNSGGLGLFDECPTQGKMGGNRK